jgi:hypothetical protein
MSFAAGRLRRAPARGNPIDISDDDDDDDIVIEDDSLGSPIAMPMSQLSQMGGDTAGPIMVYDDTLEWLVMSGNEGAEKREKEEKEQREKEEEAMKLRIAKIGKEMEEKRKKSEEKRKKEEEAMTDSQYCRHNIE